ncbi:ABC transporter permease [Candidatus Pantoea bituminis]|uniref:ABC transporter permease n=1 Tax=Candidatus Pantoea bituminis TaxID=2831036 RepID=UPI001C0635DF|nr:ABC transporter permease [Pantoea bituminis]
MRVIKRLSNNMAVFITTVIGLLCFTFLIGKLLPIDPVLAIVGEHATADVYAQEKEKLGLNNPIPVQFLDYLKKVVQGDFGTSVTTGKPVLHDVWSAVPATLELGTTAMLIGLLLGIPSGVLAAVYRNKTPDRIVRFLSILSHAVPGFWLGLIFLLIFYVELGWTPGPGRLDIAYQYSIQLKTGFILYDTLTQGEFDAFKDAAAHLILPAMVLGLATASYLCRLTRGYMIEALASEYVTAARMKGMPEHVVIFRHCMRNIAVPLLTSTALCYVHLLEGAVLTETIFTWPGLGLYITQSIFSADLPAVMGAVTFIGIFYLIVNKLVDSLYPLLDARINKK